MNRWSGACVGLLLLGLTTLCASAAGPKHVLILFPFGHDVTPFSAEASAFCTELERKLGGPVDFDQVSLDLARFDDLEKESPLVDFVEARFKRKPVDLVVVIGAPSMQFAARYRERIFRETPVLAVAAGSRFMPPGYPRTNGAAITYRVNPSTMVEDILQLQPQTTNIVMVFGASPLENFWASECRREFQPFTNRVGFTWLDGLSLEQIIERCAALPPHSFIALGLFVVDGVGVPCENNDALRRLHEAANAPLFGFFASDFGRGTIGGRLYPDSEAGTQGARTAVRILRGERPEGIPPQVLEASAPVYDWRELQRWGISEARLPAGSIVRFRQPGFWDLYQWWVVGTAAFCLLQTLLTVSLLVNRARRLQAEAEATLIADISSKFVNLPPGEVEREIMDSQRRIFEVLDLDVSGFWQWSAGASGFFRITHVSRTGEEPQLPEQMNSREYLPWFQAQMLAGRTVAVCSTIELPSEAARDRETFRQFGFKSNLTIPLSVGGEPPIGALGFSTTRSERKWPDALVKRLQLVAQIFTNALARKHADQALRDSEERMTLAAKATGVGVWMWNIPGNEIWGSERWLVLFGFAPDSAVTFEKVIQRIHPDDRKMVEDGVRRTLTDRNDYLGDYRVVLPDGTERWIVARGRMYQDAHGKPARMLGTAIDITHRKQTELALMESELRYRALFETAPEGIALIGTDGYIRAANPVQARLYGYESPRQLEGLYAPLCVAEKDRERAAQNMKDLLNGEELPIRCYTAVRQDGSEFMVEVMSAILRGPGRDLQGYLCLTRDITETRRVEAALRNLSGRLINAHEEERARLARELHDDVTQRLARLAIDAGRVERGANGVSPAETMRSVRDGLVRLSEDIHALSYRLHPAVLVDLGLAEAMKAECERFSRQESIVADVDLQELPPVVPLETALCLFRVTQEALRNVARHARARTVKVSLRALDGGLQLAVRDDGAGFAPALQRERPSLGLASMGERVRLLEGELDIESAPGQGTTILVWVPLKKS